MVESAMIEAVRSRLPVIYRDVRRSEAQSQLSETCAAWIRDLRLPSILDWDGGQLASSRLAVLGEVGTQIGRVCGSTAWTVVLFALHRWIARRLGSSAKQALDNAPVYPLIASSFMPTGTASKVGAGFTLSGRWDWITGVDHANWLLLNAKVAGSDETRFFLIPAQEGVSIRRTEIIGLRASGSHSILVQEVFVAEEMSLVEERLRGRDAPGAKLDPDPLLRAEVQPVLAVMGASVAVGLCEGVLQRTIHCLNRRGGSSVRNEPIHDSVRLGEGISAAVHAHWLWQRASQRLSEHCLFPAGETSALHFRLAAGQVVNSASRGASAIAALLGSRRSLAREPVHRSLLDLNALCSHYVYQWNDIMRVVGSSAFDSDCIASLFGENARQV